MIRIESSVTIQRAPAGEGSLVRAIVEGDASGFFKLAESLMRRMVQRSVKSDYARLKELLESAGRHNASE